MLAHGHYGRYALCVAQHGIIQTACHSHVAADIFVDFVAVHVVGREALLVEPELFEEAAVRELGYGLPAVDELLVLMLACKLQGVHDGVVPQRLYLDGVSGALRDGTSVDHSRHPRQGSVVGRSPYQAVVVHDHLAAAHAAAIGLQDGLHGLAVARPQLLRADMSFEILQRPVEPQRCVGRDCRRGRAGEVAVAHVANHRIEYIHAVLLVALRQRYAGQRHERVASYGAEPRVAGYDLRALARTTYDELTCRVLQAAQKVDLVGSACQRGFVHGVDRLLRGHHVGRG